MRGIRKKNAGTDKGNQKKQRNKTNGGKSFFPRIGKRAVGEEKQKKQVFAGHIVQEKLIGAGKIKLKP